MAEYTIDKIEYGGNIYHLQDANTVVSSTYNSADQEVIIIANSVENADIYEAKRSKNGRREKEKRNRKEEKFKRLQEKSIK